MGLPLQRVFELPSKLDQHNNYVEVTMLAIVPQFRREAGFNCVFYMMNFLFRYTRYHLNSELIFATCLPRDADFYRGILFFEEIGPVHYVDDYLGYPAECLFLSVVQKEEHYRRIYKNKKFNIYHFFASKISRI